MSYYPARDEWQTRTPDDSGLDAEGAAAAVRFHLAHESPWPRDFLVASGRYIGVADEPPGPDDVLGPVRPRGGPNGLIPGVPASCYAARGAGSNVIFVDPDHDLIVVVRWIAKTAVARFLDLVVDAVRH